MQDGEGTTSAGPAIGAVWLYQQMEKQIFRQLEYCLSSKMKRHQKIGSWGGKRHPAVGGKVQSSRSKIAFKRRDWYR
jgi:ribosomal protein S13